MVVSECEHNELFLEFGSSTQMEKVHVSLAKCPQISQIRLFLETNSQKGVILKLFPGGVCFWRGLANGVGELDTWRHLVDSLVELVSCCPRGGSRHLYRQNAFLRKFFFNFKRV